MPVTSFLQRIRDAQSWDQPLETLVVFPTRRACVEFRNLLVKQKQAASFLPHIIPVGEIPLRLCPYPIVHDHVLLMELFESVREILPDEDLDHFLAWGPQLLSDFNEIDRQLLDAESVYQTIHDYQELSERFHLDPDDVEGLQAFWNRFSAIGMSTLQQRFRQYWDLLPGIYRNFTKRLLEKQLCYEGLAWRIASEKCEEWFAPYKEVVFAGFYALTGAEDKMLSILKNSQKLKLYVDADKWYVEQRHQEAGHYFRKGFFSQMPLNWIDAYLTTNEKRIKLSGVGGKASTAHEIAAVLQQLNESNEGGKTVVVLPDDQLLFPLLEACRQRKIEVNPSMGFPLSHSPVFTLLLKLRSIRSQSGTEKDLQSQQAAVESYVPELMHLFHPVKNPESAALKVFLNQLTTASDNASKEEEIYLSCIALLNELHEDSNEIPKVLLHSGKEIINRLKSFESKLSPAGWWKLLTDELAKIRMPFVSSSKDGVHILGFLETRLMDYDNVIIASMNEGIFPGPDTQKTLIPYAVRKAFKLPCKEEKDAVTSYHFYRLLQRASQVFLFYNSEQDAMGGGEKSRFLYQIDQELIQPHPHWKAEYVQIHNAAVAAPGRPISITKNKAILQALQTRFGVHEQNEKGGLSASALQSYLSCGLRFYLDQIAGIRPDEEHEDIDAALFGTIFHELMEKLYKPHTSIDPGIEQTLRENIGQCLHDAVAKHYSEQSLNGNDFLMQSALELLAGNLVSKDIETGAFEVIGLEEPLRTSVAIPGIGSVYLKGIMDRIDRIGGHYRIVDYKTGKDEIKKINTLDDLFQNPKYKAAFQLNFYLLLHKKLHPDQQAVAGIYALKNLQKGLQVIDPDNISIDNFSGLFEEKITALIREIFSPEIPFEQTHQHENCHYCHYKTLCRRE